MAADRHNRATFRATLASGIENKCVTVTGNAQQVYNHKVADFEGQSPVVVVASAGSDRAPELMTGFGQYSTLFSYEAHVFVAYAAGTIWTESDSADRLDVLEKDIADWVADNQGGTLSWEFGGETNIGDVMIGGEEYRHEIIPIVARIP